MLETFLFYLAATVSIVSTLLALSRYNAAHALVYLIVSLLASAIIFFLAGAPFAAALEVLVYAGAIMVLFVFVIMMLNLGADGAAGEHALLKPKMWTLPSILVIILLAEIVYVLSTGHAIAASAGAGPHAVGMRLFGYYVVAVELASMLLLAALVGAWHLGHHYLEDRRSDP